MHDPRLKGLAVGPESIFAVAEWDSDLVGCFGKEDRVFAVHPANEAQAFAWLASLRQRGIGWKAAEQQINAFLKVVGEDKDHRREQIKRAQRMLKPWLLE